MGYHGYYVHDGGGPHVLAILFFVLLLLLLIGLAASAFGLLRGGRRWQPAGQPQAPVPASRPDPLELLRLRYARGEIDRETFLQANEDLGGQPPPQG